ncbi:MAG: response regulator [Xanthomonadales bacterium]
MNNRESTQPGRVLVVEDDPVCRRHTAQALRRAGRTVKQAGGIDEALRLATDWRPALILTDLHLPDGSGAELARRVRARWPAGQPPPQFVAMTAADPARCAGMLDDGDFSRVLRKPFTPGALTALSDDHAAETRGADARLQRLARREVRRQIPRMTSLLESGRLGAAARLAHRLAASAAVCGAAELGRRLQAFSDACANRSLPGELAETFTAARRSARDFVEGVASRCESG